MNFDLSDLADSIGCATGFRSLVRPPQQQPAPCCEHHSHAEGHRRRVPLEEADLFSTDERVAPPVIGL